MLAVWRDFLDYSMVVVVVAVVVTDVDGMYYACYISVSFYKEKVKTRLLNLHNRQHKTKIEKKK